MECFAFSDYPASMPSFPVMAFEITPTTPTTTTTTTPNANEDLSFLSGPSSAELVFEEGTTQFSFSRSASIELAQQFQLLEQQLDQQLLLQQQHDMATFAGAGEADTFINTNCCGPLISAATATTTAPSSPAPTLSPALSPVSPAAGVVVSSSSSCTATSGGFSWHPFSLASEVDFTCKVVDPLAVLDEINEEDLLVDAAVDNEDACVVSPSAAYSCNNYNNMYSPACGVPSTPVLPSSTSFFPNTPNTTPNTPNTPNSFDSSNDDDDDGDDEGEGYEGFPRRLRREPCVVNHDVYTLLHSVASGAVDELCYFFFSREELMAGAQALRMNTHDVVATRVRVCDRIRKRLVRSTNTKKSGAGIGSEVAIARRNKKAANLAAAAAAAAATTTGRVGKAKKPANKRS